VTGPGDKDDDESGHAMASKILARVGICLFLAPLLLTACGPNTGNHKLYDWPTGPVYPCGIHSVSLPASVVKLGNDGISYVDTVVRDRCLDAIRVQCVAFEADEGMLLPPCWIGVTDQQIIPWLGADVGGGWEAVDSPEFSHCILNSIGNYENVWPVYHELHHVVFGDPYHKDPRWLTKWNPRMMELGQINADRPYPPGVDPYNH
jgi:hypothetical protein